MASARQRALNAFVGNAGPANQNAGRKQNSPVQGADQIGFYNATHVHGEPAKNLINELKKQRLGGAANAQHDSSLDIAGQGVNRANAPMGPVPAWVARQMAQGKGFPAPGGIPPGVTPTKPVEAVQGSDALTGLQPAYVNPAAAYPVRRPAQTPPPGPPRPRRGGLVR